MKRTQTPFEALEQLASDLDIGFISGALQPPDAGRLILGERSLAEILLPVWSAGTAAIAVAAGGPPHEHVSIGRSALNADALARLEAAAQAAGGHVYQGRIAQLTPADWLERHGDAVSSRGEGAPSTNARGWRDDMPNAEITSLASLETSPLLAAAQAAGWPATFANEPVLFLDDQPLYYLLMRENVGRNVTLLIGALHDQQR